MWGGSETEQARQTLVTAEAGECWQMGVCCDSAHYFARLKFSVTTSYPKSMYTVIVLLLCNG